MDLADGIKDLDVGRLSWITQVNPMSLRGALEEASIEDQSQKKDVKTEAGRQRDVFVDGPQAEECVSL